VKTLKATMTMYRTAFVHAARATGRSLWAAWFLLATFLILHFAAQFLGIAGLVGGFALALIHAVLVGTYLALLEETVNATSRHLRVDDLHGNMGRYFNEVIFVLFIFFLAELPLVLIAPLRPALLVLIPAATIAFNPVPEMIYLSRSEPGLPVLRASMRFVSNNWPEWFGAHMLLWFPVLALGLAGWLHPMEAVDAMGWFGPFFSIVESGILALKVLGTGVAGCTVFGLLFMFSHFFMLFRGYLFKELNTSSRRSRAWQDRF